MIGCLQTRVLKQPTITLYFEFENELKFYNLEARLSRMRLQKLSSWHFNSLHAG